MNKEIKICSHHQDGEQTPLIWTFAFNHNEYWCPACGANYGALGAGDDIENTLILEKRLKEYEKLSRRFLRGNSLLVCSMFKYKGEYKKFSEMSKRFQTFWINRSKEWKYKF